MSAFYHSWFKICWKNKTVTDEQLNIALQKGMITTEEYEDIVHSNETTS